MESMFSFIGIAVSFLFETSEDGVEGARLIDTDIDAETAKFTKTLKELVRIACFTHWQMGLTL